MFPRRSFNITDEKTILNRQRSNGVDADGAAAASITAAAVRWKRSDGRRGRRGGGEARGVGTDTAGAAAAGAGRACVARRLAATAATAAGPLAAEAARARTGPLLSVPAAGAPAHTLEQRARSCTLAQASAMNERTFQYDSAVKINLKGIL